MERRTKYFRAMTFVVAITLLGSCANDKKIPRISDSRVVQNMPTERVRTVGFNQVTMAGDGEYVTLTEHIDIKYLCMDLSATQKDICTTTLVNSNYQPFHIIEIRLRVCSETLRRNCIVFPSNTRNVDFREVSVLDDAGQSIDFDGERLIEPPNTWTADPVRLKLTGRVTVVNGKGKLVEPIEKIEEE